MSKIIDSIYKFVSNILPGNSNKINDINKKISDNVKLSKDEMKYHAINSATLININDINKKISDITLSKDEMEEFFIDNLVNANTLIQFKVNNSRIYSDGRVLLQKIFRNDNLDRKLFMFIYNIFSDKKSENMQVLFDYLIEVDLLSNQDMIENFKKFLLDLANKTINENNGKKIFEQQVLSFILL